MGNLIFNAFYSIDGKSKSVNNSSRYANSNYLKNSIASLYSAKCNNPDCKVVLYTNEKISEEFGFDEFGIEVRILPFEHYVMPEEFCWSYAFYKLCCLRDTVKRGENDYIVSLDTDTYVAYSLNPLWDELELTDTIMLYDTNHRIDHPVRKTIIQDYEFMGGSTGIAQYGGEFIAGSLKGLQKLINNIDDVYDRIKKRDFFIAKTAGDEELLSMAAYEYEGRIQNAGPYIQRYWTRTTYLVSTNWKYDHVLIWHLPAEKNLGLCELYNYIKRNKNIPSVKKAAIMCNLPKGRMPVNLQLLKRLINKIRRQLNI